MWHGLWALDGGREQGSKAAGPGPWPRTGAGREAAGLGTDASVLSPVRAAAPGDQFSCPVHSWSTGEEVAGDILKHRLAPQCPTQHSLVHLGTREGRGMGPNPPEGPIGFSLAIPGV